MAIFKCKICGGALEIDNAQSVATCEYCGTKQTLPRLDDERRTNLYDRANHFRRNNDFDKAMGIFEQILNEEPTDAEAYWSIVLCRYGIEYVEDPTTRRRVPTVNRAQFTSIFDDEDYKSAIANADGYQRELYEAEANAINELQKSILAISQKEEPFDVFICYKETDANGRRTQDSVLATELYHELTREGFKVFFSRITLEDKLGQEYEPYIFAALNSAKVMVVLGTKPEHFNAVWVKNEWSRYLALIKNGAKKTLIPAYRDMDPYNLPEEFSHLQAQDMSKLGFMQDLTRGIQKIVDAAPPKATVKETVVQAVFPFNIKPLLKRAFMFLEDGDFESANEYCEKVLDQDPENAEAYLGKLMVNVHARRKGNLANCGESYIHNRNYQKALRFGDESLQSELKVLCEQNEQAIFGQRIYNNQNSQRNPVTKTPFSRIGELPRRGYSKIVFWVLFVLLGSIWLLASEIIEVRLGFSLFVIFICASLVWGIQIGTSFLNDKNKTYVKRLKVLKICLILGAVVAAIIPILIITPGINYSLFGSVLNFIIATTFFMICTTVIKTLAGVIRGQKRTFKKRNFKLKQRLFSIWKSKKKLVVVVAAIVIVAVCVVVIVLYQVMVVHVEKDGVQYKKVGDGYHVVKYEGSASYLKIPAQIKDIPVTTLESNAFKDCTNLLNVIVPTSVTWIQQGAFSGCTSLRSITLPFVGSSPYTVDSGGHLGHIFGADTNASNKDCVPASLQTVVVTGGEHVSRIASFAFLDCANLTSISLPISISSIGSNAFSGCENLKNIVVPSGVLSIGWGAFSGCKSLETINIPEAVTEIGEYTFSGCTNLKSIKIPKKITLIGNYAFDNCDSLTQAVFENKDGWRVSGFNVSEYDLDLKSSTQNAIYLRSIYVKCLWSCSS